ncbi:MAG: glycosyltransferase [Gammaproteobacteria bacterium]|nr:glycosyltransferase [Gammaproteobacteria bacterium]MBU1722378.1 glycosyltransferase [Gammaproteobacteria bacterium]MBU2004685.1 glycosyltransferase [Gammaproteobacteria bacterium]
MKNKISRPDVAVIVLTRNAGRLWPEWISAIQNQTVEAGRYLVIDSASEDHTAELARAAGMEVQSIDPRDFSHGGTRQLAAELCPDAELLVYLTQDALLKQADSLASILARFDHDPQVGLAYGRHLPRPGADLLECHARSFTYPPEASIRDRNSFRSMGYRAAFSSDVYAVYRARALRSIGGFPQHIIVSEDSYVAARLLLANWKAVYAAESTVEHSHQYSLLQVFRRYFDVGVFHASEQPLMQAVGMPDREAWVYVRSLIRYLAQRRKLLLPLAALQTLVKLLAFRLGKRYQQLPRWLCAMISVQKAYWEEGRKSPSIPLLQRGMQECLTGAVASFEKGAARGVSLIATPIAEKL